MIKNYCRARLRGHGRPCEEADTSSSPRNNITRMLHAHMCICTDVRIGMVHTGDMIMYTGSVMSVKNFIDHGVFDVKLLPMLGKLLPMPHPP